MSSNSYNGTGGAADALQILAALRQVVPIIHAHAGSDGPMQAVADGLKEFTDTHGQIDLRDVLGLRARGGVPPWRQRILEERARILRRLYHEHHADMTKTAAARTIAARWRRVAATAQGASSPPPGSMLELYHRLLRLNIAPLSPRTILRALA